MKTILASSVKMLCICCILILGCAASASAEKNADGTYTIDGYQCDFTDSDEGGMLMINISQEKKYWEWMCTEQETQPAFSVYTCNGSMETSSGDKEEMIPREFTWAKASGAEGACRAFIDKLK